MAHIHEKIDFGAEVFIVYNGTVLLRKHDKYGIWLSIGGHIELDEDPNQAAIREVKEEVGLDITLWDGNQRFRGEPQGNKQLIPPIALNRHHVNETHEHICFIFFGKATTDEVQVGLESDRSDEWRWLTKDELESMDLREDTRFYARMAIDELS